MLIFCTSQLVAALNAGRPVARTLHLVAPRPAASSTCRETSGDGYRRLREALERLAGTRITTNLVTGPKDDPVEVTTGFGLIEAWQIVRRTRGGRMVSVSVTLSEWLYRAILAKSVLTLSPRLLFAAPAARAAGLRAGAETLRAAGGLARLGRGAAQEVGLRQPGPACSGRCCAR